MSSQKIPNNELPNNEIITPPKNEYNKKLFKKSILEFKKEFQHFLLTSRFTNDTWNENEMYRKKHKEIACVYCSPDPITVTIPKDSIIFILEMNNDENKILGIGMIRNNPFVNRYSVYNEGNYNRYVYVGKNRIDRLEMTEEEERIMKVFDILCFTGNKHMKRGRGLKSFPVDMLYRCSKTLDLVKFIRDMFKRRISNTK